MVGFDAGMSSLNYLGNLVGDDLAPRVTYRLLLTTKPQNRAACCHQWTWGLPFILLRNSEASLITCIIITMFQKGFGSQTRKGFHRGPRGGGSALPVLGNRCLAGITVPLHLLSSFFFRSAHALARREPQCPTRASVPDEGLSARREQVRASPTRSPHGPPHDSPHTEADLRRIDGLQLPIQWKTSIWRSKYIFSKTSSAIHQT